MGKKVIDTIKLQIPGGQANPAPPVGPALGQAGVNIMEFCKQFNAETQEQTGTTIPVLITVYQDRSFSFELKSPPAATLLKEAAELASGATEAGRETVGRVPQQQVEEIAERKMRDLNARSKEAAVRIIEGTAKSMGIEVE